MRPAIVAHVSQCLPASTVYWIPTQLALYVVHAVVAAVVVGKHRWQAQQVVVDLVWVGAALSLNPN